MKKTLIILLFWFINYSFSFSQCVNFISTNPDNPLNNGCPNNENLQGNPRFFDWRGPNIEYPVNMPNNSISVIYN